MNPIICRKQHDSCRGRTVKGLCLYHYRRKKYSKGLYKNLSFLEKEKAVSYYMSGMTGQEVANEIGCGRQSISNLIHSLGLTRKPEEFSVKYWLGKKRPDIADKQKINMAGTKHSVETRKKMSDTHQLRLKDYIRKEPENIRIRKSLKYKLWKESVFKRDNFTCQICFCRGGDKQADHIKPFALFPDLRFDLDNGRTLCVPCHRETPTYGRQKVLTNE